MRLYAPMALVGLFLVMIHPMLRAQDSKAEKERAIAEIKNLTNLRKLTLDGTKVTDAGVRELQKALPKVKIIH